MKNSFVRPQSGWGWFIILLQVAALSGLADSSARAQNIEPGKEQKALSPDLKPGDYIWEPEVSPAGPVAIIVSLAEQTPSVYRDGVEIGRASASSEEAGHSCGNHVYAALTQTTPGGDHPWNALDGLDDSAAPDALALRAQDW